MGNACKGNLLRLQSCFLVVESFSMFNVKHDVSTTIQLFNVKRWLFFVVGGGRVLGFSFSCWGWMFHVEHGSLSRWENDSASQHIDACDHFLEVWKSKLHGMLFRFVPCWRRWGCQQLNKPHG